MTIKAALLWTKSPRCSISSMIIDDKIPQVLTQPKIHYLPTGFFAFRKAAKSIIKNFFSQIKDISKTQKDPIIIEYKIVFFAKDIPYLIPAKESLYVYTLFMKYANKFKNKKIKLRPQLRKLLSHKSLRVFKKNLRHMELVSRKRDTGFEYHLWTVVLHATKASYAGKLKSLRYKLVNSMWSGSFNA